MEVVSVLTLDIPLRHQPNLSKNDPQNGRKEQKEYKSRRKIDGINGQPRQTSGQVTGMNQLTDPPITLSTQTICPRTHNFFQLVRKPDEPKGSARRFAGISHPVGNFTLVAS